MNFLQRRRILKKANFLDLKPARKLEHELRDDAGVNLLMPRFRNRMASTLFQPAGKDKVIRIRLDRFGSQVWLLIDGESTVAGICGNLAGRFPEELGSIGDTSDRVTKFLALLYQERYITFLEIEG